MTAAEIPPAVEGPGRVQPPGAARAAKPRTWTLPDLVGTRMTANDRPPHWAARNRVTREWRTLAAARARQLRIPALDRAHILVEWLAYDRRRRDPANASPMGKAAVDGIVDAGVLPDDSAEYLAGPDYRLGPIADPVWRVGGTVTLRITISEVAR